VKGAFLDADKAFEVINGSRTLELRMLRKTINTMVLARFLASHPLLHVKSHALDDNENAHLRQRCMRLGLPAPLFTIDFERAELDRIIFTRFFDCLEPAFGHQVSLGQSNTVILCPGLTSHSEMGPEALREAGITATTVRIAVGDEDPRQLIAHFIQVARLVLDPAKPGFSARFMSPEDADVLYQTTYLDVHRRWVEGLPSTADMLK
jgi:cystathionine beta-lyase/cystathionine gamma-synthase